MYNHDILDVLLDWHQTGTFGPVLYPYEIITVLPVGNGKKFVSESKTHFFLYQYTFMLIHTNFLLKDLSKICSLFESCNNQVLWIKI